MNKRTSKEVKLMGISKMTKPLAVGFAVAMIGAGVGYSQFIRGGGTAYNATGVDAQRTSWVREDRFI